MKAVVQRVQSARLSVDGAEVCKIGLGLVVYLGIESGDDGANVAAFCKKLAALRIFSDGVGKLNLSVKDVGGSVLLVSNFTLCADVSHGNRPDFMRAMKPDGAKLLFDLYAKELGAIVPTVTGVFGADMTIEQVNIGPVTILY